MKKEFYIATIIFMIFIIGFYIYAIANRWGEERIGSLAANNIAMDTRFNPIIQWRGRGNFTYNSIVAKSVTFNDDSSTAKQSSATVVLRFTHQNGTVHETSYTFTLRSDDSPYPCTDTFCINV